MNFPPAIPALLLTALLATAQLPPNYQLEKDWLIDSSTFQATITTDEKNHKITRANGLLQRVIDTELGTTVAFDNLMTGHTIIRAIEQEGSVTIDGKTYSIGGVTGQTNRAFITPTTLEKLTPAPNALTLTNHHIGDPQPRLKWKKIRHHSPHATWPPKGKYLRLDYTAPAPSPLASAHSIATPSSFARRILIQDNFQNLSPDWEIRTSPLHPRSSFQNEGKPGEIYTLPHTAVFAQQPLPENTALVEAEINTGTDNSTSWGPGIALVYKDRTIKFNIRPGGLANVDHPVLGIWDGTREIPNASGKQPINTAKNQTLRIRIAESTLHFEAKENEGKWQRHHTLQLPPTIGKPTHLRVGKLDKHGADKDLGESAEPIRLQIHRVAAYSPIQPEKIPAQPATPSPFTVSVHYEIYDGIPTIAKWITVNNHSKSPINLDRFTAETLAVVEKSSPVETRPGRPIPHPDIIDVETDMAMGGLGAANADRFTVFWKNDPAYKTQVNYLYKTPCLLEVEPARGPDQTIPPGATFRSFHTFILAQDSGDRERRGLARRRNYRTIAPWITENPIMLHCKSSNPKTIKNAIDQAAETGFEMVILSFGSGFNMENSDPAYLAQWKKINDYAQSKNIELGAYSLYSSRRIGGGNAIVTPEGTTPTHGNCPAITSEWGQNYIAKIYNCFAKTGFTVFENDGAYPGDEDITPRPPLQKGLSDSRWVHWRIWTDLFKHLRAEGVYMNFPDYYYLSGANKSSMGYREVNWSLPRAQQRIHTRQNIYDGTWLKTPSMGWMFVPLTQYHGGGAAATIEPLKDHLPHYKTMLLSNLGLGVQACYRGTRIYDTPETKQMVTQTITWFKQHRAILESDLIHGRRADGRDLDWMLHVNPALETKALLAIYNPTNNPITKKIAIPLYYAGLSKAATYTRDSDPPKTTILDPDNRAHLTLTIPPNSFSHITFKPHL